ncbi:hypothetical protein FC50_GL002371 [Lacticaseibacillus pantheris DSM 15945 = JCM 12539 = NBRC 106106]|uniref:Uncharacterized protein n=1 Tax=Lacticaseibacillus pantheris DSM 15945 = JCM 12539 = NBRC 106106 TaxID=1423783 RepID=A0A0R1UC77_9LACO|nr:hypothetical protein [Lacticaseibacillus pantheris]KRL88611.1 hypothetical protein FC50_GL002371 [Lacticaseibacillus pantheris DSM 15945 = JCM 12539 = NBRC 106106]
MDEVEYKYYRKCISDAKDAMWDITNSIDPDGDVALEALDDAITDIGDALDAADSALDDVEVTDHD